MGIAEEIKRIVTMTGVFEKYGFEQNRNKSVICPFHHEKTASLRAYNGDRSWKCFGCNQGGSAIDFVMLLYDLNFSQALIRINADFQLGLTARRPTLRQTSKYSLQQAQRQEELKQYRNTYHVNTERFRWCREILQKYVPRSAEEPLNVNFSAALHTIEYLNQWFEQNPWR